MVLADGDWVMLNAETLAAVSGELSETANAGSFWKARLISRWRRKENARFGWISARRRCGYWVHSSM